MHLRAVNEIKKRNLSLVQRFRCVWIAAVCPVLITVATPRVSLAASAFWSASASTGDWNSASNWNPNTVPNGPNDTASFFNVSSQTQAAISVSTNTIVNALDYNNTARAYTITITPPLSFTISGAGITNGTQFMQNFVLPVTPTGQFGSLFFTNSAAAGEFVSLQTMGGLNNLQQGGRIEFFNTSTAAGATITNQGGGGSGGSFGGTTLFHDATGAGHALLINNSATHASRGAATEFDDTSSAEDSTIVNNASQSIVRGVGSVLFKNQSSARDATIINKGGIGGFGGSASFFDDSTGSAATITNYGSEIAGSYGGGYIYFYDNSTAGIATITNNAGRSGRPFNNNFGGTGTYFFGNSDAADAAILANSATNPDEDSGFVSFAANSTAANAILIAKAGSNGGAGGVTYFSEDSDGGTSQVKIYGNAMLDISGHNVPGLTIGSLEGSGNVFVGGVNLSVGSNNIATTFGGMIQEGDFKQGTEGGFTKIGTGSLTFQGRADNNYIADEVSLGVASGSIINLNFFGDPDRVRSLLVNGVSQPPGVYGGPGSGAPHQLSQFSGPGTVLVTTQAVSRQAHGNAGSFDVDLPLTGLPGLESRSGGPNGDHQLVITFLNAVTFQSAAVIEGTGTVANTSGNGTNTVVISLTGVTNAQFIVVSLSGVNDGTTTSDLNIAVTVLAGDTNGDGTVNSADIAQTKSKSGQAIDATNFRNDVNGDGFINSADISLVKSRSGTALPSQPSRLERSER